MQFWFAFVALFFSMFGALFSYAQDAKKSTDQPAACCQKADAKTTAAQSKGDCCAKDGRSEAVAAKGDCAAKTGCSAQAKADGGCSGSNLASCNFRGVPAMMYKVGDEEMDCPAQAQKVAAADKKAIKFVVDGKTYDAQADAMTAYADVLEKHLQKMTAVQYVVGEECVGCPVSAKALAEKNKGKVRYRVASTTFDDQAVAEKAAKLAKDASDKVAMKMMVGDKEYQCPASAQEACKDGQQIAYQIGETRTPCKVSARVELAKAKILSAMKAVSEVAGV